jgi:hypothetical protein
MELQTSSQLLEWAEQHVPLDRHSRMAFLTVYRFGVEIGKTRTFQLTFYELANVLFIIKLHFPDIPSGLRFLLTSWVDGPDDFIQSKTDINGVLQLSVRKLTNVISVEPSLPARKYPLIIQSIVGSEGPLRRTTHKPPVSGSGRVKITRKNPEIDNFTKTTVVTTQLGAGPPTFTSHERYNRSFVSVRTPNFTQKSVAGTLPENPYTLGRLEIFPGAYDDNRAHINGTFINTHVDMNAYLLSANVPTGHASMDENLTINKLAGRINARSNLAESLIQSSLLGKTVGQNLNRVVGFLQIIHGKPSEGLAKILGPSKGAKFGKGLSSLKKGGSSGAKLLADLWLEYRYAWLPLIGDVDSSLKAYSRYLEKHPKISSVTATSRKKVESYAEVVFFNFDVGNAKRKYYTTSTTVFKIGIEYKIDALATNILSGLGLTSPAALAWELTPFSFVVDWFLPIGPALTAFSAFEGLGFLKGYKTYFTRRETRLIIDASGKALDYFCVFKGDSKGTRILVNRTVLTNFPSTKLPRLKSPLSLIHAANAAALVTRLLTR